MVSVSGGKMYGLADSLWNNHDAKLDRTAENTQLFQVISINGDKLQYEAFTSTGHLYDAFDLIKQRNCNNKFIEKAFKHGQREDLIIRYHVKIRNNIAPSVLSYRMILIVINFSEDSEKFLVQNDFHLSLPSPK